MLLIYIRINNTYNKEYINNAYLIIADNLIFVFSY